MSISRRFSWHLYNIWLSFGYTQFSSGSNIFQNQIIFIYSYNSEIFIKWLQPSIFLIGRIYALINKVFQVRLWNRILFLINKWFMMLIVYICYWSLPMIVRCRVMVNHVWVLPNRFCQLLKSIISRFCASLMTLTQLSLWCYLLLVLNQHFSSGFLPLNWIRLDWNIEILGIFWIIKF